jgi:hypothetical protein
MRNSRTTPCWHQPMWLCTIIALFSQYLTIRQDVPVQTRYQSTSPKLVRMIVLTTHCIPSGNVSHTTDRGFRITKLTRSTLGDPVNTGALKNMPSSYGDYNSIGGMAWGACGRWVVVSISWPLPDNFPLGNGGLPVKSVGAPVSTIEDWCGPSGQEKLCSTTLTLNTVLPSGYFK